MEKALDLAARAFRERDGKWLVRYGVNVVTADDLTGFGFVVIAVECAYVKDSLNVYGLRRVGYRADKSFKARSDCSIEFVRGINAAIRLIRRTEEGELESA